VHPAPPTALRLAQRLKQLRQSCPQLTQEKLAAAFNSEAGLAAATVSSWESLRAPKLPPVQRLEAYGRFFCTPRSVEGEPRLLPLGELTEDETREYEKLKAELLGLREAFSGESAEAEQTFRRSWHFPDAGRVTFFCAQLPGDQIGPFGDPSNPNYTVLQTYADIDSLMELHGHIRAENPTATVHFKTPAEVQSDDLMGHVILLGGVVWNEITGRLSEMAKLPIRQIEMPPLESGEIFIADDESGTHEFWPKFVDGKMNGLLTEDVGLLVRVPNPLNASRTLTLCNGIHSHGVYGAVRTLADAQVREANERYILENFGDAQSFAILMSVKVIKNRAITPDFNSPGVVLYQWGQCAA
jgi:hypothetical protein